MVDEEQGRATLHTTTKVPPMHGRKASSARSLSRTPRVAVVVLFLCAQGTPSSCRAQATLVLREVESLVLPTGFAPTGADRVDDDDFAAWSAASGEVLLSVRRAVYAEADLENPILVAWSPSGMLVLDAVSNEVNIFSRDGDLLRTQPLDLPGPSIAAAYSRARGGLYVWVQPRPDLASLYWIDTEQPPERLATVTYDGEARVIPIPGGTITVLINPPFTAVIRDSLGATVGSFSPPTSALARFGTASRIVSATIVPGQTFILQTLADLRSDRRVIVLYELDGTYRSATTLDLPLAFFSSGGTDSLFAMRSAAGFEIATYRAD